MSGNELGAGAAAALGVALDRNRVLRRLDLSLNRIDVCPYMDCKEMSIR